MTYSLRDNQLKMLWTARIDYKKGSKVGAHTHYDYDQLLVILSGAGQITIEQETFPAENNRCFLFVRDVPHSFYFSRETITLDFKFQLLDHELASMVAATAPGRLCGERELQELKHWYQLSLSMMKQPGDWLSLRIDAGFKGTLASLLSKDDPTDKHDFTIYSKPTDDPIASYLQMNFAQKITISALARQFGYSPNYLIKLFRNKMGVTPIQLLQEIRLEKAKHYLEFTSLPISEIAEHVGWTLPYFSKMMKHRYGASPSRYRELLTNTVGKDIILEQDFTNQWRIT